MLKKLLIAAVAIVTVFALAACGENDQQQSQLAVAPGSETPVAAAGQATEKQEDKKDEKSADKAIQEEQEAGREGQETKETKEAADQDPEKTAGDADPEKAAENEGSDTEKETKAEETPEETTLAPEGVEQPEQMLEEARTGSISADGEGLYLRTGPDSTFDEIDLVPDGTEVSILAEQDGWGYTSYEGQYGWLSLTYVTD